MNESFTRNTTESTTSVSLQLPSDSLLASFFSQFEPIDFATWEPAQFKIVKDYNTETPALFTIVMRTIGSRLEELEEAFICLQAQCDQDFEVCLVGHNVTPEQTEALLQLVEAQPPTFCARMRFITCTGEGRARPLNAGFSAARSDYAIILDDDDLVFDNWIEAFHKAAVEHPGQIIHAQVIDQAWDPHENEWGRWLSASGTTKTNWCCDFDFAEQLAENHCPIMGLAFPLFPFKQMGIVFNESLSTTEDWDFLMRTAYVCGVHNIEDATSIYRIWHNDNRSMSQHGVEEWSQNYLDILDARADRPMLVPGSVLPTLLHTSNIERDSGIYLDLDTARATVFDSHDAILATDIKPSYTRWLFPGFFTFPIPRNTIEFTCIADHPQAAALGIWFGHCRTVTFRDIDIVVEYADNSSRSYGILDVEHNGLRIADNQIAFMSNGPWIKIPCASPHNPAVKIRVQFYFDRFIDDEILHGSNLVLKAQNKLRSLIHGKRSRKD